MGVLFFTVYMKIFVNVAFVSGYIYKILSQNFILSLGMGDGENFMSRYIVKVIITIIDIITISVLVNSQTLKL